MEEEETCRTSDKGRRFDQGGRMIPIKNEVVEKEADIIFNNFWVVPPSIWMDFSTISTGGEKQE